MKLVFFHSHNTDQRHHRGEISWRKYNIYLYIAAAAAVKRNRYFWNHQCKLYFSARVVQWWYLWVECDIWNIARVIKTFSTMAPMWYFSSWMPILSLFWFSWRRLASFSHKKLFWNIWCHSSTFPISKLSSYIWLMNFLKHCTYLIFVLNSFLYFCWLPFIFVLINFSKLPEHCRHLRR